MLKRAAAGHGFMHESCHKDKPEEFTRAWFAWANSLFAELIMKLVRDWPGLVLKEECMD